MRTSIRADSGNTPTKQFKYVNEEKMTMNNDTEKYLNYIKRVAKIISEKGIAARVIKIEKASSDEFGLRVTEDPNSIYKATVKLETKEELSQKNISEEEYAENILQQILNRESPVRAAEEELKKKPYDEIKKYIFPRIMDRETYKSYLMQIPNRDYLDYAVAYCYICDGKILTITNDITDKKTGIYVTKRE